MAVSGMYWFSVLWVTRAPGGVPHAVADDDAADTLMDLLEEHSGVVTAGTDSWGATVSIHAADALEAANTGGRLVGTMAMRAGMPAWPAVRTEVVRQDVLDADNARPTLPDLVSAPEAAEMLGISAQRFHELAAGRQFPQPGYELRTGKLWLRDAIAAFGERWERKPGRPDRGTLMRKRVTSALLDAGLTMADSKVWLGQERTVVLQLEAHGSAPVRRRCAARVIAALGSAGFGVTDEGSRSAEDMEAYLAGGHTAQVFELAQETVRRA